MGDDSPPDYSQDEQPEKPTSHRLQACYRAFVCGAWRIDMALRLLAKRRQPRRRGQLDSPSGFHAR